MRCRVGAFIAQLHERGIYFRSLHPGNIIVDGSHLGLIDAALAGYRDASRLPAKDLQRIADHAERVHASASR